MTSAEVENDLFIPMHISAGCPIISEHREERVGERPQPQNKGLISDTAVPARN